ncbi:MAG: LytTR family transcriptional regulator DNA-binding domain-containing protein [Sporocytophaga sp.]|uniref:LytR/AlgR family response regulator transcription factor n=1 Tax=Sporocytophaga sp. TaxID=2231183 RepID=UPI001B09C1FF|nr:LytTR family transcriptional regulator DNA-binding domain-containing protein [Sporocytophaga sp.]MBO9699356.1 LytTR family transcriptional regulator DNA-binding domain-containing protein [Sporocytophaga sp.]
MTKYKVIITDDEPLARSLIRSYLKDDPDVEIIAECGDGFSALKSVQELHPDLLFLDVQMPKLTGFEMLELMENPPLIIFSTAYDEYALKAFEMNAADYLLKPYSRERFEQAVKKAKARLKHNESVNDPSGINNSLKQREGTLERIAVKTGNKINVLQVEDIFYLEAQDDYVMIYCSAGKFLKQQRMKYFEDALDPEMFMRVHRSYIVNLNEITQIEPYEKDSHLIVLRNGAKIPVSRSNYSELKKTLNF